MIISHILKSFLALIITILRSLLTSVEAHPQRAIAISPQFNISTLSLNASIMGQPFIICDAKQYGQIAKSESCYDLLTQIDNSGKTQRIGRRGTGNWDITLPKRYISCR